MHDASPARHGPAPADHEPEPGLRHPLVLLIEDDALEVSLMEEILRPLELRILHAVDLASARALLARTRVDLVISDLSLPDSGPNIGLDGLRNLPIDVPIVVVSGWSGPLATDIHHGGFRLRLFDKNDFDVGAFVAWIRQLLSGTGATIARGAEPRARQAPAR